MDEELILIHKLGVITSTELGERMDKSIRSIIRKLNKLEEYEEIKIITFKTKHIRRRLYVDGRIYNDLVKINKS